MTDSSLSNNNHNHFITMEDPDLLKKKYEEMSFEEMSKHLAESNRQMNELLTTSMSSSLSASTLDTVEEPEEEIHPEEEHKKYTRLFARAASNGDIQKVKEMLSNEETRAHIDINARDSDGTPPLIYAACFGKTEIAQILIDYGASVDIQDNFGWSALMWATNNSHEALVKILLESGASATTKSAKGRTVFDFVNTENQKMVDILATNPPRDSMSSTSSLLFFRTASSVSSNSSSSDHDYFYGLSNNEDEAAELRKKLFESTMALALETTASDIEEEGEDGESTDIVEDPDNINTEEDDDDDDNIEFHWDKCSPDQMFVFNSDDLNYILDTVITNIQLPLKNQQDIHVPSNVIFLSARFAHYFSSDELLNHVLEGALSRISKAVKIHARNIHVLAFWLSNLTKLLFYVKKDTGLVVVTAEQQLRLAELISETYNMMILDTEKRLLKVLGPAMLEHEEIPVSVDFTDDWHRFFRSSRSSTDSSSMHHHHGTSSSSIMSPQSITSLLSSTLFVLQSYDVHPIIIIQALAQCFHYISCEVFNRMLTNKKLLCRSKAMQVRMNFSHLEDWISVNKLPNHLLGYLNPTIQLLQLLQCLTQLKDLVDFINTSKKFDALNAPQIKRCVISYRYEVNEERIPDEIEKYAMQCAEDTVRHKQQRKKAAANNSSVALSRAASLSSTSSSRRTSFSQFISSSRSSAPSTPISEQLPYLHGDTNDDDREEHDDTKETKDTRFMLPFSVPTTAHMISFQHWDSKGEQHEQRPMIPVIPEEWMDKLDHPSASRVVLDK